MKMDQRYRLHLQTSSRALVVSAYERSPQVNPEAVPQAAPLPCSNRAWMLGAAVGRCRKRLPVFVQTLSWRLGLPDLMLRDYTSACECHLSKGILVFFTRLRANIDAKRV